MYNKGQKYILQNFTNIDILKKIVRAINKFFVKVKTWEYPYYDSFGGSHQVNIEIDINNLINKITLSDINKFDLFPNFINKRVLKDKEFKNDENSWIMIANIYLYLLKEFLNIVKNKNNDINCLENDINEFYTNSICIPYLLEALEHKGLCFDENTFTIYDKNDKVLTQLLDEEKMTEYYQNFLFAKTIKDKEDIMIILSTRILETFNSYKNDDCIKEYFGEKALSQILTKCNGYFRHTIKDNGQTTKHCCTEEWSKLNDLEKEKIMKNMLSIYITVLTILKNDGKLEKFKERL